MKFSEEIEFLLFYLEYYFYLLSKQKLEKYRVIYIFIKNIIKTYLYIFYLFVALHIE